MWLQERLGLELAVVQAGMGGGIATAKLAGAVSAAGGLGTVGILPPPLLQAELTTACERAGGKPVAANLLVPFTTRAHVEACTRGGAAAVTLHGGLDRRLVEQLHATPGAFVIQTVGTPQEARRALAAGADALVVQGIEAGGHLVGIEPALDALSRVLRVAHPVPVLLAGGIADRGDVERALQAGAQAVVAGTRFLLTEECAAHPAYKRRVLDAERTIETQLFGLGWPMRHRVVPNAATDRWCRSDPYGPRAIRAIHAASRPLARLPMRLQTATTRTQRPAIPLFGPSALLQGMPDRLVEATPLYAGDTALRIDSVRPAGEIARLLGAASAEDGSPSPTMPLS